MVEISYPVKMYRLGEPPITVNSSADYARFVDAGWQLTIPIYRHKDYPCVMYHVANPPKTVRNFEELEVAQLDGWTTAPIANKPEQEILKAKMIYHNGEVDRLQKQYHAIVGEYYPVGIYDLPKIPESCVNIAVQTEAVTTSEKDKYEKIVAESTMTSIEEQPRKKRAYRKRAV